MSITLLLLQPQQYDSGNCRLICTDQFKNRWIILNDGSNAVPQYSVYSVTSDGEPCSPLRDSIDWMLIDGVAGTEFITGLCPERQLSHSQS